MTRPKARPAEVVRSGQTGNIVSLRCPSPECRRMVPVYYGRMTDHDTSLFAEAEPCPFSGVEVVDETWLVRRPR